MRSTLQLGSLSLIPAVVSTSTSAGSIFKFNTSKNNCTLKIGSLASNPFSYFLPTPSLIPNNGKSSSSGSTNYKSISNSDTFDAATTSITANVIVSSTSSPSIEASVSSFTVAPVFKFVSSRDPLASVSTLSATSREATEAKTQNMSSGNVAFGQFGSNAFTSSRSNIFGGSSVFIGTSSTSGCTTAIATSSENSRFSDASSNITNSRSGFFSSSSSTVTNTDNGIFGGTSANTSTCNCIFGGTSLSIASTGSSIFSTTTSVTSTRSNIFGFSAPAASISTTQTQGLNPFKAINIQAFATRTSIGQLKECPFSSLHQHHLHQLEKWLGIQLFPLTVIVLGSSASVAKHFGSRVTFGMISPSSKQTL